MIHDIGKFIGILSKYEITAHEFMLPYLLYLDERDDKGQGTSYEGKPITLLYEYHENVRGWTPKEVRRLEDKGLLLNDNRIVRDEAGTRRKRVSPDMMNASTLFVDEVFAPVDAFDEFVQAYPDHVENFHDPKKPKIPLKIVANPGAWEELERFYDRIVTSRVLHEKILDVLEWAKREGYINMNISKFVASRHWEALMNLRKENPRSSISDEIRQA